MFKNYTLKNLAPTINSDHRGRGTRNYEEMERFFF